MFEFYGKSNAMSNKYNCGICKCNTCANKTCKRMQCSVCEMCYKETDECENYIREEVK